MQQKFNDESVSDISNSGLVNLGLDYKIANTYGIGTFEFISKYASINSPYTKILHTSSKFNVESIPKGTIQSFVNIRRINDIRFLNKFFESVNKKLPHDGIFIGIVETTDQRKEIIYSKYKKHLAPPLYLFDFIFNRVMPKMKLTQKFYYLISGGNNRALSLTEVLGRLISSGFEIINHKEMGTFTCFAAKKVTDPDYNEEPSYGPLFKMRRVGKNGKIIHVYKFRTMHPYSEYLQKYIYENNNLDEGGKFKDDFRVTSWGKFMRKFWLDEFPMFINVFKGELKLVGVRPLSSHYMSLYNDEVKEMRIKHRPGLVPPYYADMPKSLDEIMESEMKYMKLYDKYGIWIDIKYFFLAFYNIIFKRARSN
ncbi:MAG: sugar transferase [Ignavibacteriaceae bacterium]|nr:sugar transferase [Ignavibacteriaceae bacterium]